MKKIDVSPCFRSWQILTIIIISFFAHQSTFAARFSNGSNDSNIQEILVSASLQPLPLKQSANAVTVIDREQLQNRLALNVTDLLRDVPGVAVSRTGVLGSQTQVRMRGAEANHVMVLIDGIEVNDPSLGDEANWANLSATDIERIEVMRGPQSALYGSDALAGVVNIQTARARKPATAELFSEMGSFSTNRSGLNLGFSNPTLHARLSAHHLETDGENISRVGDEKDGYRNNTVNLSAGARVGQNLSLSLVARDQKSTNQFDADADFDGLIEDRDRETDSKGTTIGLTIKYNSSNDRWRHRLTLSNAEFDNTNFSDGRSDGATESSKMRYQYVGSRFWDRLEQQVSILVESDDEEYRQSGGYAFGPDANVKVKRQTESLALEYRLDPLEPLTLGVSARHDGNDRFDDAETYRLEALYRLDAQTRMRGTWSSSIKNPTFTELYGIYYGFKGNPDLKPESSIGWSLGLDRNFTRFDGSASLTFFKAKLDDEIKTIYAADFTSTAKNFDGTSDRDGIELSTTIELNPNIILTASFTYSDSSERNSVNEEVRELRRPKHIGSLNVAWQPASSLMVNANFQYNGSQSDVYFPPWPNPMETVSMDDYTLVNVRANYKINQKLDIFIRLDNLTDEKYEDVFGYQTLGFGFGIGARYSFWGK